MDDRDAEHGMLLRKRPRGWAHVIAEDLIYNKREVVPLRAFYEVLRLFLAEIMPGRIVRLNQYQRADIGAAR